MVSFCVASTTLKLGRCFQLGAFWLSFGIVFLAELGDKSQLLALTLATKYKAWVTFHVQHTPLGIREELTRCTTVFLLRGLRLNLRQTREPR
jgi:hypothetical protein